MKYCDVHTRLKAVKVRVCTNIANGRDALRPRKMPRAATSPNCGTKLELSSVVASDFRLSFSGALPSEAKAELESCK